MKKSYYEYYKFKNYFSTRKMALASIVFNVLKKMVFFLAVQVRNRNFSLVFYTLKNSKSILLPILKDEVLAYRYPRKKSGQTRNPFAYTLD